MLSLSQIACLCGCGVMLPLSWIAYTHMNMVKCFFLLWMACPILVWCNALFKLDSFYHLHMDMGEMLDG